MTIFEHNYFDMTKNEHIFASSKTTNTTSSRLIVFAMICKRNNLNLKNAIIMNEIVVRHGDVTRLAKICGCSIQSVRFALKGRLESDLATKIRKEAIAIGGVEMSERRLVRIVK